MMNSDTDDSDLGMPPLERRVSSTDDDANNDVDDPNAEYDSSSSDDPLIEPPSHRRRTPERQFLHTDDEHREEEEDNDDDDHNGEDQDQNSDQDSQTDSVTNDQIRRLISTLNSSGIRLINLDASPSPDEPDENSGLVSMINQMLVEGGMTMRPPSSLTGDIRERWVKSTMAIVEHPEESIWEKKGIKSVDDLTKNLDKNRYRALKNQALFRFSSSS